MDTTRNVLQKGLGSFEYAKLLDSANQISIFGEPVKDLSRDELLAALIFTIQTNQEQEQIREDDFKHISANNLSAGLW